MHGGNSLFKLLIILKFHILITHNDRVKKCIQKQRSSSLIQYYFISMILFLFFYLIALTNQLCPSSVIDYSTNFLANGNFQTPNISPNTFVRYAGGIASWTTPLAEVGVGTYYNTNWATGQVASLDSGVNQAYTQNFNIPTISQFFFTIDYARRQGQSPSTSGLRIYWNGRNVAQQPTANDDSIHQITLNLTSQVGQNTIIIQAMGHDDGYGSTIDNAGVYSIGDTQRQSINGQCVCTSGYFDNGIDIQCLSCTLMVSYCSVCSFSPNSSQLTPSCLNNTLSGLNCTYGDFLCSGCQSGYYLGNDNLCHPIQIPSDFNTAGWNLKYKLCNKFTAIIPITLQSYQKLLSIRSNNTNITILSYIVSNGQAADKYFVEVEADYYGDIANQVITFTASYISSSNSSQTAAAIVEMSASDVPLSVYTSGQCSLISTFQDFTSAIFIASYIVLAISSITVKIIGLELMGVLQLAFFSLAFYDRPDIYLHSLATWKGVNGFNIQLTQQITNVSLSVSEIKYKDNFIYNVNFMFGLILLDLFLGLILFIAYKITAKQILKTVSFYLIELVFITLLLFSTFNISFSIGIHFSYSNPDHPLHPLGTFFSILAILVFIFAIILLQFASQKYFGQFKNKYKNNCVNRAYIAFTLVYRFAVGLYISVNNQNFVGTLVVISFSLCFILYNIVNLPYRQTYNNYRANICHISHLIVLLVANYYRSMKLNMDPNQKSKIHSPAFLQMSFMCICIITSTICLMYQIVKLIKNKISKKRSSQKINTENSKNMNSLPNFQSEINFIKVNVTTDNIFEQTQ